MRTFAAVNTEMCESHKNVCAKLEINPKTTNTMETINTTEVLARVREEQEERQLATSMVDVEATIKAEALAKVNKANERYQEGVGDCKIGRFNPWYLGCEDDETLQAYLIGWAEQNTWETPEREIQVATVPMN